ncbi:hypothetical protein [Psychroflexus montanilacus]|uniref:hypothetical protein n=1 Tax=Psychroflexus montanilacus TaxID=2873598 RepID=UPI001CCD8169|nr:hypothetical protein [Psychroflexus montanilacus]MBZ9652194.1 hypothetical protein [Psychroflexus montanilacus]
MKTIFKIITFLTLLFFSISNLLGQSACSYTESEITIELNGWDISRTDYTHEKFIEVTGLDNNSQLTYSGEKDTEEFGYPWYYYGLGESYFNFAGVMDNQGDYNGLKRIFSFKIKKRGKLNVNGIQVGDTVDDLKAHFNHFDFCTKTNEGKKSLILRYSYQSLIFEISPNGKIKVIELYSPI